MSAERGRLRPDLTPAIGAAVTNLTKSGNGKPRSSDETCTSMLLISTGDKDKSKDEQSFATISSAGSPVLF